MATERMNGRLVVELRSALLTYSEVGMTKRPDLPVGYRAFRRSTILRARADFQAVSGDLLSWMVQRRAGIRVTASSDVKLDAVVDLRLGVGRIAVIAPCHVVYVVDEADKCGFAYGTLPGHPESGEEAFVLDLNTDATITFTITACSSPATTLAKLAGPIGRGVQDIMTARYLRALA